MNDQLLQSEIHNPQSAIKDYRLFIDGSYVDASGGNTFEDVSPVTGRVIARVAEANADDVDRAVAAAKRARHGAWGKMGVNARLDLLARVADRIMERFDEFLEAEIGDTGKPVSWAKAIDIPRGAANFKLFANLVRNVPNESYQTDTEDGLGALNYAIRVPLGVVGVICPWNLPLLLMTWKVAPALACGNTVVVKPSEETPGTATLLGEVMNEVGIPPGVYNVVHGFGPGSAGEALTKHPDVAAITFTGETRTGSAIMKTVADGVKPVSFELGGKNPAIIFADADFDAAVAGVARSTFANCGQVCLCSERLYVERPIFDRFVEALAERAKKLRMGDPFQQSTTMGPLISKGHREKVLSYYQLAREEGATIVTGGGIPKLGDPFDGGSFVEPTILTGLPESARVIKEEIFGPVCHVQPFDSEDEALAMANDTEYGLCSALWTQNLSRAHRLAAQIDVGITWVNSWFLRDLRTPFGGTGISGIGREGGIHSVNFYSELRNVCVKL
ncbi:MAG: 2-hydroxymuconic semialdehyde dehydrogenase [Ignavibacteriae bacterium]|nr:2-hydroxymuconic semialdehyde dehydrogenase [Ignavibacteriota bacterium]MCB9216796.1 2-hydroxymuconic semialdehyde dehydrogenase [Ignavibacteria bacterium]